MGRSLERAHSLMPTWIANEGVARVANQVLDRRAKAAVGAASFLLIAAPVLAVGRYVDANMHMTNIADGHGNDERLVTFGNGTTVLLPHGSVARRLADFLKLGTKDDSVFQIGDGMFTPGTITLTSDGWARLNAFSNVMKAHPDLKAEIVVGTRLSQDAVLERLEELRARQLYHEAGSLGVAPERMSVSKQPIADLMASHKVDRVRNGSQLYVLVSKS